VGSTIAWLGHVTSSRLLVFVLSCARWLTGVACVLGLMAALPAHAEMSAEELAKLAQNPVGNLIRATSI